MRAGVAVIAIAPVGLIALAPPGVAGGSGNEGVDLLRLELVARLAALPQSAEWLEQVQLSPQRQPFPDAAEIIA